MPVPRPPAQVFAFCRSEAIHVAANFSERRVPFYVWANKGGVLTDLLSGKQVRAQEQIQLEPYEVLWLKEEAQGSPALAKYAAPALRKKNYFFSKKVKFFGQSRIPYMQGKRAAFFNFAYKE